MLLRFGLCCFLLLMLPRGIGSPTLKSCKVTSILWPVRRGANRISCPILQKALQLKLTIQSVAWNKCATRFQTEDCPGWSSGWLAGLNSKWHLKIKNNSQYNLDQRGILQVRDVTEADNGTVYRCTVRTSSNCDREAINIILLFDPEEDIPISTKTTTKPVAIRDHPTGIQSNSTSTSEDVTVIPEKTTASSEEAKNCTDLIVTICLLAVLVLLFGGYSLYRKCNDRRFGNQQNQGELRTCPSDVELTSLPQ